MLHLNYFQLRNFRHIVSCTVIFSSIWILQVTEIFAQHRDVQSHAENHIHKEENGHVHKHGEEEGHEHEHSLDENYLYCPGSKTELYHNLSKEQCEHDVCIIECDECRYEVGVVKVDESVIGEAITVGKAKPLDIGITLEATGEVGPNQDLFVIVSPRISGVVKEVFIDWGEPVKKGQKLAVLDSIELGEARAEFLKAKAMLKLAKKNYTREESLYRQNITSKKHFLDAEAAYEKAQIELKAMKEKLILMGQEGNIEEMSEDISQVSSLFTLTAPFDGTVIEKRIAVGELKKAFDHVVTIADLTRVWVWFDIYEKDIPKVKMGSEVLISVASYPEEQFEGEVTYIGDVIDEKTRTVKVRAEVENSHKKLKPGMFAKVLLQVAEARSSLALPEAAVQTDGQKRFVFVPFKDGYFIRRNVTTGTHLNGQITIVSGLEMNEPVVTYGGFFLKSEIMREKFGEGCEGH